MRCLPFIITATTTSPVAGVITILLELSAPSSPVTSAWLAVWAIWLALNSVISDVDVLNAQRKEFAWGMEIIFVTRPEKKSLFFFYLPAEWRRSGSGRRPSPVWPLRTWFSVPVDTPAGLEVCWGNRGIYVIILCVLRVYKGGGAWWMAYTWRAAWPCYWLRSPPRWQPCTNSGRNGIWRLGGWLDFARRWWRQPTRFPEYSDPIKN